MLGMTDSAPATDDDDALDAHQLLVESALPLIFETYDEAIADEAVNPLVILVDCEDELGGQIARGWLGDETIDDAIAAEAPDDDSEEPQTTVFARAISWQEAQPDLAEAFPYIAPALDEGPPSDGVFVVGITAGGASAFTAPWDARD